MKTLIKRCILLRMILVFSVCLCSIKRILCFYGLISYCIAFLNIRTIPLALYNYPSQHAVSGHDRSASETTFNGISLAGRCCPARRCLLGPDRQALLFLGCDQREKINAYSFYLLSSKLTCLMQRSESSGNLSHRKISGHG